MIGVTSPTLRNYERGNLGGYGSSRQKRQALLELVMQASGAPAEIVGLSEPGERAVAEILSRLEAAERAVPELRMQLRAEFARELRLLEARLRRSEPGDSPGEATEG